MARLTGSKLDLVRTCSGALALQQVKDTSDEAELGTVKHAYLLVALEHGIEAAEESAPPKHREALAGVPVAEILQAAEADRPGVTEGEVAYAWDPVSRGQASRLGKNIGRLYDEHGAKPGDVCLAVDAVHVEWDLPRSWPALPSRSAGAAALTYGRPTRVVVTDYKSGFSYVASPAENLQMKVAAVAVASHLGGVEEVVARVARFPEGLPTRILEDKFDAFDLQAFEEEVADVAASHRAALAKVAAGEVPDLRVGPHCSWCRARFTCPAQAHAAQQLVQLDHRGPLTPERVALAHRLWKAVKKRGEEMEPILNAYIRAHGPIPYGDGKVLKEVPFQVGELSPAVTLQVLGEMGMAPAFASAVSISVKDLSDAVGGGDVALEVLSRIKERGGVRPITRSSIRSVNPNPKRKRRAR